MRRSVGDGGMPRLVAHLALAGAVVAAGGCGQSQETGTAEAPAARAETVAAGKGLDEPSALAFRPGSDHELWVTNHGDDSIAIVPEPRRNAAVVNRRDAYAEHFVARPSGIAFDRTGDYFAVSNDSNNEVRDMVFKLNPERNRHFKDNNFMGPTLFSADTYGLAGQSKRYLEDWPQPGFGHDPPANTQEHDCPDRYWSSDAENCVWPREGSHLDMLHGSPLSAGIVHDAANAYYVLDGCGTRTTANRCRGDGHLVLVDYNRDHQEGNGFHGDGVIERYIDAPFERVDGVPSGIVRHGDEIFYSDTGAGVVRRLDPRPGEREVMVSSWNAEPASHHEQGPGPIGWGDVANGPPDGDDPDAVDDWIAEHGDQGLIEAAGREWIKPMETLGEYVYVREAVGREALEPGVVDRPSGLAAGDEQLYVADHATGNIHSFAWDGLRPRRVIETGAESLGGLALDPSGERWIYFTDMARDAVGRIALNGGD